MAVTIPKPQINPDGNNPSGTKVVIVTSGEAKVTSNDPKVVIVERGR